jgi:ABC-type multidrug transport system ATPase subunit
MLLAENLTCRRGGRIALRSLDLHVAPREIVALVGPEHAGKTSALECFLGRHTLTTGRVSIDGVPATTTAAASLVAYVPAQLSLPADSGVLTHTRNTCLRAGRRIPDAVLCATLERNTVSATCHERRIGHCTPAVQRHLALTLAWLTHAPALLIDDPTRGLASSDIDALVMNLRSLRKADRAILLATRDLSFARRLATRIVLLERGTVVETLDPNASRRAFHAESYLADLVG